MLIDFLHVFIISLILFIFQSNVSHNSQNDLFYQINNSRFRVEGELVEEATNRMFKVGDRFILYNLKE